MNPIRVSDASKFAGGEGLMPVTSFDSFQAINMQSLGSQLQLSQEDKRWLISESAKNGHKFRGDSVDNQGFFPSRALEFLEASYYQVEYAQMPFRKIFDVTNDGGPGVDKIVAPVYDKFGKAKPLNNGANDIPVVAAGGKEIAYPVIPWGIAAEWTVQELQAFVVAQRNGRGRVSPDVQKQEAAQWALENALNDQALFGQADTGSYGALNNPLVPTIYAPVGTSTKTTWQNKTPEEILLDVNTLGDEVWVNSKMIEQPDHLLLPPDKFTYIKNTKVGTYNDKSILEYLIANSHYFTSKESIVPINELRGFGYSGTGKAVAYVKNPKKVKVSSPSEATALPVQQNLFKYVMLWLAYSAGTILYQPRSMAYLEGI